MEDESGNKVFAVTARDRVSPDSPDPVLSTLDRSDYQAIWLFGVDAGDGLTSEDCAGLTKFRQRGGGIMATRDHMDLGSSLCTLGGVGEAHHFHTKNINPDVNRQKIDDPYTSVILWPNYHSGANGDYQEIAVVGPLHPVLTDPWAEDGRIHFLPAHPHEGDIDAPPQDPSARVIATGKSKATQTPFNVAVAFEASDAGGRALAQSTFHHFVDYNWDISKGKPSFVSEAPSDRLASSAEAQRVIRQYVRNLALWLVGRPTDAERRDLH
ncbi:MAG TPA: hypothetical protein VL522_07580 [Bordetella sp.]|nr:hypothetical protein [Bordetella sp.]